MNDMIVPNWHPVIVHFSVALLTTATVVLFIAMFKKQTGINDRLLIAGRTMFWIGFGALVLTVLAGLQAYYSVGHDAPSHRAMTDHRNWALATLAISIVAAGLMWREKLNGIIMTVLVISTTMLLITAYKGGDLVYRYGLGVMSMPEITGDGHDHDHEGGGHEHGGDAPEDDCGTGKDTHSHEAGSDEPDHKLDEAQSAPELHKHADGSLHEHGPNVASMIPENVAEALTLALKEQDKDTIKSLLAEDVLVLEGGHAQRSREEYMKGHMISDMAYLKVIDFETISRSASVDGDLAWVTSMTRMKGNFRDQEIDEETKEFLIMRKRDGAWRITHIFWEN